VSLLVDKDVKELRVRLREVQSGFLEAHAMNLYEQYGNAALRRYGQIGPRAEDPAETYFAGDCSPGLDALAKIMLKERLYWIGPIRYISLCSNSAEDLKLLEALSPPDRESLPGSMR
jgi:hypothetical protein